LYRNKIFTHTVLYPVPVSFSDVTFISPLADEENDAASSSRTKTTKSNRFVFLVNVRTVDTMSLLIDAARSLLVVPGDYNAVRPHHVVVLFAAARIVTSSKLYHKLADSILNLLSRTTEVLIPLVYKGLIPDVLIRFGIRIQLYDHLAILKSEDVEIELQKKMHIVQQLHTMPIAIETDAANEQHYEVPAKFYDLCLGPCKKYSSGLWPSPQTTFEESEILMLDLYCQRAGVQDGMKIVDLG
jgi:cyclopropane-fatty-acyl-phospholipid synthase